MVKGKGRKKRGKKEKSGQGDGFDHIPLKGAVSAILHEKASVDRTKAQPCSVDLTTQQPDVLWISLSSTTTQLFTFGTNVGESADEEQLYNNLSAALSD